MKTRSASIVLAALLGAGSARAVDRPGTPIGVVVAPDVPPGKLPAIVVHFHNTANEVVRFWCEWKVNGELKGDPLKTLPYPKIQCLQTASCTGLLSNTTTVNDRTEKPVETLGIKVGSTSTPIEVAKDKGFKIIDVDWETEYCFHLKARKESDGVVSGEWSPWACGRTPQAPALPAVFPRPVVTFLPGDAVAAGSPAGGVVPNRILLEWENAGGAAHYEIEGPGKPYRNPWTYPNNVFVDSSKRKQSAVFDVAAMPGPFFYTVCAVNVRGKTCSAKVSTSLLAGKENAAVKAGGLVSSIPPAKLAAGQQVPTPTPGAAVRKVIAR